MTETIDNPAPEADKPARRRPRLGGPPRQDDDPDDRDLLGIMLRTQHPDSRSGMRLTDRNIHYQILTFLVAGHETTSGTPSYAPYYLMSRSPSVLAEVRARPTRSSGPIPT